MDYFVGNLRFCSPQALYDMEMYQIANADPSMLIENFHQFYGHHVKSPRDFQDFRKTSFRMNLEGQQCLMDIFTMEGRLMGCAGFIGVTRSKREREATLCMLLLADIVPSVQELLQSITAIATSSNYQLCRLKTRAIQNESFARLISQQPDYQRVRDQEYVYEFFPPSASATLTTGDDDNFSVESEDELKHQNGNNDHDEDRDVNQYEVDYDGEYADEDDDSQADKHILRDQFYRCVDCDIRFKFTAGEHYFYTTRSFEVPKRCPVCRYRKSYKNKLKESMKYSIASQASSMSSLKSVHNTSTASPAAIAQQQNTVEVNSEVVSGRNRVTPQFCPYWQQGTCRFGSKCRLLHTPFVSSGGVRSNVTILRRPVVVPMSPISTRSQTGYTASSSGTMMDEVSGYGYGKSTNAHSQCTVSHGGPQQLLQKPMYSVPLPFIPPQYPHPHIYQHSMFLPSSSEMVPPQLATTTPQAIFPFPQGTTHFSPYSHPPPPLPVPSASSSSVRTDTSDAVQEAPVPPVPFSMMSVSCFPEAVYQSIFLNLINSRDPQWLSMLKYSPTSEFSGMTMQTVSKDFVPNGEGGHALAPGSNADLTTSEQQTSVHNPPALSVNYFSPEMVSAILNNPLSGQVTHWQQLFEFGLNSVRWDLSILQLNCEVLNNYNCCKQLYQFPFQSALLSNFTSGVPPVSSVPIVSGYPNLPNAYGSYSQSTISSNVSSRVAAPETIQSGHVESVSPVYWPLGPVGPVGSFGMGRFQQQHQQQIPVSDSRRPQMGPSNDPTTSSTGTSMPGQASQPPIVPITYSTQLAHQQQLHQGRPSQQQQQTLLHPTPSTVPTYASQTSHAPTSFPSVGPVPPKSSETISQYYRNQNSSI